MRLVSIDRVLGADNDCGITNEIRKQVDGHDDGHMLPVYCLSRKDGIFLSMKRDTQK